MPEPGGPSPPGTLHHRVSAAPERLISIRRSLTAWARKVGLATEIVEAVTLATYEAMANVVDHAYRGGPGALDVHASVTDDRATVVVSDHGRWRPTPDWPPRAPDQPSGRGIPLIEGLSDDVAIIRTEAGTTVRMSWALP
jgi:serine/threonine-protein kinase RsbW